MNLDLGITPGSPALHGKNGAYVDVHNAASYRIVSCCIKVTFTGNISQNQGMMGGAYIGEAANAVMPKITRSFIDKYPNSQRGRADEGIRIVWYPRDPADHNY